MQALVVIDDISDKTSSVHASTIFLETIFWKVHVTLAHTNKWLSKGRSMQEKIDVDLLGNGRVLRSKF